MIVLGINNMHDASAALVVDGRVVAAAEEERFVRVKHTTGLPERAMAFCLARAGITAADLDWVCASWKPWVLGTRAREAARSILVSPRMFGAKAVRGAGQMRNEWAELFTLRRRLRRILGPGRYRVAYVDHHLAHAASAFLCSPFDEAAVLTVDGAGEAETTVLWHGRGTRLTKLAAVRLPHSLGQFYSAVTAFLGFKVQSDEYKVMGLASFGEPVLAERLAREVIRTGPDGAFRVDPYAVDYHLARRGLFPRRTRDLLGEPRRPGEPVEPRHADVAASAQAVVENALFHVLEALHRRTGLSTLCMAGGVAFNCVANGKIPVRTRFRELFVQPAAGDAGSALGAALYLEQQLTGRERTWVQEHAYLGPAYSSEACARAVSARGLAYRRLDREGVVRETADALARGRLVCWFQGRMEWGPRALGNRSFLADPRREDMKEIINRKIKKREPFRPFAPSVLEERSADYFDHPWLSPFMLLACPVRPGRRSEIPAVTHVDGTARPQSVSRRTNPRYWSLIRAFEERTGVPVILNTSLNVQEPVVCTPDHALDCFLKTGVDLLVLEDLLVEPPRPRS